MHTFTPKPKIQQTATTCRGQSNANQGHQVNSPDALMGDSATKGRAGFSYDFSRIPLHFAAGAKIHPKLRFTTTDDTSLQLAGLSEESLRRSRELSRARVHNSSSGDSAQNSAPAIVHDVTHSPGQPLDQDVRGFIETGLGHDFSRVRIHADGTAARSAQALNANAYTLGQHIVFDSGQYAPQSGRGKRLLAHELVHVVQQGGQASPMVARDAAPRPAPPPDLPWPTQAKLKVGAVDDPSESEADRIADQVVAMRNTVGAGSAPLADVPPVVHEVLRSAGRPLDAMVRTFMEPRFGYDFSQVRVHTGRRAAESAESIHALAYTAGQDIVFSHNTYAPSTHHGRELLAHELAHTIQQRDSGGIPPSPAPDGIFESSAEAAGRAVANGQSISGDFPACGFGLARSPATPAVYNDEDLSRAIQETSDRLKQASYPGRDSDAGWMAQLKAEAARRASFKQPAAVTPPKPADAAKPPRRDPAADRAAAVAEAEAAAAQMDQDVKAEDEDEPMVTPMAISNSKSTAKPPAKASAKSAVKPAATASAHRARQKTPDPEMAKFLPGGFTDEDIYKDSDAEMQRIDEGIARDREISKTPYSDRLQTVRIKLQAKSNYWYSRNEAFSHMTGAEVWSEGMADGLFIESEKQSVYEDQNSLQQFINEKMAEDARNARAKFESDKYRAWVAQGEQLSAPQTIIQPFVVAAAAPELVAAAYFGVQTGAAGGEAYNSCVHGTKEECAVEVAKLAAQIALERAIKGKSGEAPKSSGGEPPSPEDLTFPRGTDVTNASAFPSKIPTAVSEAELVASNARNPASIKPQAPQAHQQNWQALGGEGKAPPAYRDPEGNVRVSTDSPLLQPATGAGISPIRADQSGSPAPKEVKPVPAPASTSSRQVVGTADTGKAPAVPAPDPLAKTPAAPAQPAAAPDAPRVSPHEPTGQAGTASQRAVAQNARKQIAPPQAISEEAVQRMQNNPRPSSPGRKGSGSGGGYTIDHAHHELAWQRLGGHGDAPPAFVYDNQFYLDPSRWPPKR